MNTITQNMKTNLAKWGNSLAIRIPSAFTRQLELTPESIVEIAAENDTITIKRSKYKLEDLVSQITEVNKHTETDTGILTGKEQW